MGAVSLQAFRMPIHFDGGFLITDYSGCRLSNSLISALS